VFRAILLENGFATERRYTCERFLRRTSQAIFLATRAEYSHSSAGSLFFWI